MGVLGKPTLKRQDLIISTTSDQTIGVRWWKSSNGSREPADLTGFTGVAELRSIDGDLWTSIPLVFATHPDDPLITLTTKPADFTGAVWAARRSGEYRFKVTSPAGEITTVLAGYVYFER